MAQPRLEAEFFVGVDGVIVPKARTVSTRLRFTVLERDGYRCRLCGCRVGKFRRREFFGLPVGTADHVLPRARGGRTELANLRTLCEPCNAQKGGKSDEEYKSYLANLRRRC